MSHYAFAATRVAHRPDATQVKLADKLVTERRTACRVEGLENVEMLLNQLGPRQSTEIKHQVVHRVDSVGADRDDDITVAGNHPRKIVVTFVARNRMALRFGAGPLQQEATKLVSTAFETSRMTSVQQNYHRQRTTRQVGWIMNRSSQFYWSRKVSWLKCGVSEVVLFTCHRK